MIGSNEFPRCFHRPRSFMFFTYFGEEKSVLCFNSYFNPLLERKQSFGHPGKFKVHKQFLGDRAQKHNFVSIAISE